MTATAVVQPVHPLTVTKPHVWGTNYSGGTAGSQCRGIPAAITTRFLASGTQKIASGWGLYAVGCLDCLEHVVEEHPIRLTLSSGGPRRRVGCHHAKHDAPSPCTSARCVTTMKDTTPSYAPIWLIGILLCDGIQGGAWEAAF
jgi:hypothetical protein